MVIATQKWCVAVRKKKNNYCYSLIAIVLLLALLISLPPVQSKLVFWAKDLLAKELGVEVSVSKVDVAFPGRAVFHDLIIYDQQQVPAIMC